MQRTVCYFAYGVVRLITVASWATCLYREQRMSIWNVYRYGMYTRHFEKRAHRSCEGQMSRDM